MKTRHQMLSFLLLLTICGAFGCTSTRSGDPVMDGVAQAREVLRYAELVVPQVCATFSGASPTVKRACQLYPQVYRDATLAVDAIEAAHAGDAAAAVARLIDIILDALSGGNHTISAVTPPSEPALVAKRRIEKGGR